MTDNWTKIITVGMGALAAVKIAKILVGKDDEKESEKETKE